MNPMNPLPLLQVNGLVKRYGGLVAIDHVDRARLTGGGSQYSTLACSTPGLLLCQFRRAVIATKASTAAAIAPRTIG